MADSVAVITISEHGTTLKVHSEGCGGAGEYADEIVALLRTIWEKRDTILDNETKKAGE